MKKMLIDINAVIIKDGKIIDDSVIDICQRSFKKIYVYDNMDDACDSVRMLFSQNIAIDVLLTLDKSHEENSFSLIKKIREINNDLFSIIFTNAEYTFSMNDIAYYNTFQNTPISLEQLKKNINTIISRICVRKEYRRQNSLSLQYQNALDTTSIVSKTDIDGIITYVNDAFCNISGYSREELLGENHNILRDPDHPESIFKKMWSTIKAKMIYKHDAMSNIAKDGSRYYVNTTVFPILNENREIVEFMSVRNDVTSMMKSLITEKKAKESQKRFLANMSHEIRTPLNAILGFSNILMDDEVNKETQKEYIKNIHTGSEVLLELINNILDISKIESGKLEIENTTCILYDEYNDLVKLLQSKASEKELDFVNSIDPRLKNMQFNTDITKIKQILSNLISNAIKFTSYGKKIESTLSIMKLDENKASIEYVIKDTGIGIEANKIENIFKPFIQEDQSITRKFGGTGLGLYITKEILDLLGGTIDVQSIKNEGTTFTIKLELDIDTSFKNKDTQIECIDNKQEFDGTVLVVEDVPLNQQLIKIYLEKKGLEVLFANDGIEGVEMYKTNKDTISLILMDINMPRMDGISTMEVISDIQKNEDKKIPIVALTANAIKGDREEFMEKGFDEYISKPIKEENLIQVLYLFLQTKETHDEKVEPEQDTQIQKDQLDMESLANKLGLPVDLYKSFIDDYIILLDEDVLQLKDSIERDDFDTIKELAHKLKGVSGNIGLEKMYEYFALMENKTAPHIIVLRKIEKEFFKIKNLG